MKIERRIVVEENLKYYLEDDVFWEQLVGYMRDGSTYSLLYIFDGQSDFNGNFEYSGDFADLNIRNDEIQHKLHGIAINLAKKQFAAFAHEKFVTPFEVKVSHMQNNSNQGKLTYSLLWFLLEANKQGYSDVREIGSGLMTGGFNHSVALAISPVATIYMHDIGALNMDVTLGDTLMRGVDSPITGLEKFKEPVYVDLYDDSQWYKMGESLQSPLKMRKMIKYGNVYQPYHTEMRYLPGCSQFNHLLWGQQYAGLECTCWDCRKWCALIRNFNVPVEKIILALIRLDAPIDSSYTGAGAIRAIVKDRKEILDKDNRPIQPRFKRSTVVKGINVSNVRVVEYVRGLGGGYYFGERLGGTNMRLIGGHCVFDDRPLFPIQKYVLIVYQDWIPKDGETVVYSERIDVRFKFVDVYCDSMPSLWPTYVFDYDVGVWVREEKEGIVSFVSDKLGKKIDTIESPPQSRVRVVLDYQSVIPIEFAYERRRDEIIKTGMLDPRRKGWNYKLDSNGDFPGTNDAYADVVNDCYGGSSPHWQSHGNTKLPIPHPDGMGFKRNAIAVELHKRAGNKIRKPQYHRVTTDNIVVNGKDVKAHPGGEIWVRTAIRNT